MTNHFMPDPNSEGFDLWVRATALDAASRVIGGVGDPGGDCPLTAPQMATRTMTLVKRFEIYLNTGSHGT